MEVDPRDDAAFAAWAGVVRQVERDTRPDDVPQTPQERRAAALAGRPGGDGSPPPEEEVVLLLARREGRPVGAARGELPLTDNTHVLYLEVHVLPSERRRSVGSALLADLVERARAAGRSMLMADVDEPPGVEGRSAGRSLLEGAGFAEALVEVRRDLALPVDPARLDAVEAACRPHARGYRVRTWRGACPGALLEDRAALARQMSLDVPLGDLAWGEEQWDAARVRTREQLVARQGRTLLGAGAVDARGALVAFTEVAFADAAPEQVHQWETFVLAEHRGHRLGTLVKTAVLRRLPHEVPRARVVTTTNAVSNAPMVAVNDRLGFRPCGQLALFQRALA